jgi:N-acyl-D-aspartate/D-glutamate deacylase
MNYDLKIVGGTIIDGTSQPGVVGNVGIKDGKVVALGAADGDADQIIDASGKVVCPGFVDIHTHYDAQILWDRMMTISPWHGVTTVVMGNCGFGVAPTKPEHRLLIMRTLEKVEGMSLSALQTGLGTDWPFESFPEYMDAIEKSGSAINVAVLAGHTPIRMFVMGEDAVQREATDDEVEEMKSLVREAMDAGAIGFATSHATTHNAYDGNPVPSRKATTEEIDALLGAMAESGRGIMQATIGPGLFFNEFAELAGKHGRPITWTALLAGIQGPGSHRNMLERTRQLIEQGNEVVPQVACRPLNFEFDFENPFPFESIPLFGPTMKTDHAGKRKIYSDPAFRDAFRTELGEGGKHAFAGWVARTVVSYNPKDPSTENMPLAEVAANEGKDPVDYLLDLSMETDFKARVRMAALNYDEDEVQELLEHADTDAVIGLSDAGAHASQLCDACFSTHFLGYWVREKKVMPIERAIHILTQRPAEVFGITDRGVLAEGRPADVVVFDPDTIGASALSRVQDLPASAERLISDASGIDAVVVNGRVLRQHNTDAVSPDGALPGRLLRGGAAA